MNLWEPLNRLLREFHSWWFLVIMNTPVMMTDAPGFNYSKLHSIAVIIKLQMHLIENLVMVEKVMRSDSRCQSLQTTLFTPSHSDRHYLSASQLKSILNQKWMIRSHHSVKWLGSNNFFKMQMNLRIGPDIHGLLYLVTDHFIVPHRVIACKAWQWLLKFVTYKFIHY